MVLNTFRISGAECEPYPRPGYPPFTNRTCYHDLRPGGCEAYMCRESRKKVCGVLIETPQTTVDSGTTPIAPARSQDAVSIWRSALWRRVHGLIADRVEPLLPLFLPSFKGITLFPPQGAGISASACRPAGQTRRAETEGILRRLSSLRSGLSAWTPCPPSSTRRRTRRAAPPSQPDPRLRP